MLEKPHTVFVSHAHVDNELCDRYVDALRKRGLDVWYDRTNMQDGCFLSDQISEELEQRTAFVVLLTPASLASYYVKLETDAYRALAAQDRTWLFLPVRVIECKVPTLMAGIKWIDAVVLGFGAATDALATALRASRQTLPTPTPRERALDLLTRGQELVSEYKLDEALAVYEQALELDPTNAAAWALKGDALAYLKRYEEELTAFERALTIAEFAYAWNGKGNALRDLKRYEESLMALNRALELDSIYADAMTNKAYTLLGMGRTTEADAAFWRGDRA